MCEPGGVIGSTINAVLKLVELTLAYREVSKDTQQLLSNIELTDSKIDTALRLRRVKSAYLDPHLKREVDRDIDITKRIVSSVGQTIERCRADLETNQDKVKPINRLRWMFRDSEAFLSQERTLANCLQALACDISQMTAASPPPTLVEPPTYSQTMAFHKPMWSPSVRRKLAQQRSRSSLVSTAIDERVETEVLGSESPSPAMRIHDGHPMAALEGDMQFRRPTSFGSEETLLDCSSEEEGRGWQHSLSLNEPLLLPSTQLPDETCEIEAPVIDHKIDVIVVEQSLGSDLDAPKPKRLRSACIR